MRYDAVFAVKLKNINNGSTSSQILSEDELNPYYCLKNVNTFPKNNHKTTIFETHLFYNINYENKFSFEKTANNLGGA